MFRLINENPYRFLFETIPQHCQELLRFHWFRDPSSVMPIIHLQMQFDQQKEVVSLQLLTFQGEEKFYFDPLI